MSNRPDMWCLPSDAEIGYRKEWLTIGRHRVLLECRDGFPGHREVMAARIAVEFCNARQHLVPDDFGRPVPDPCPPTVLAVYYDDKHGDCAVLLASTQEKHATLADELTSAFQQIYGGGNYSVQINIVPPGDMRSEHYHYAAHLFASSMFSASNEAELAAEATFERDRN